MVEGQKSRQIGKGMIPRGKTGVKPQKEKRKMTTQSTNEGQRRYAEDPVLGPKDRNETPGNLEPENGENSLQNLESKEAIVAQDDAPRCASCGQEFTWNEKVQAFEHDDPCVVGLEAALKESGNAVIDAEFLEVDEPRPAGDHHAVGDDGAAADLETAMAVGFGSMKFTESPGEAWITKDGIGEVLKAYGLGDQPDGSCGFIVKIQEGYTDAVRQWAESDGVPVERWLSDRLYEYISTYGEPAKGR